MLYKTYFNPQINPQSLLLPHPPGSYESSDFSLEVLPPLPPSVVVQSRRFSRSHKPYNDLDERKRRKLKPVLRTKMLPQKPLHFHVTYWMFYPFSEGKAVCVLDLGFLGSWPIPSLGGMCLGRLKEYGSHVGDWEHVSLYFKVSCGEGGRMVEYDCGAMMFIGLIFI